MIHPFDADGLYLHGCQRQTGATGVPRSVGSRQFQIFVSEGEPPIACVFSTGHGSRDSVLVGFDGSGMESFAKEFAMRGRF